MLKRLRVDNFKGLINVVFEPAGVNLLTGLNNSGKTTLCQAMVFLRRSVELPLAEAALAATGDVWNLTNAYLDKKTLTFDCEAELVLHDETCRYVYHLEFTAARQSGTSSLGRECSVECETLTVSGGPFGTDTVLLSNECGEVSLLHEGKHFQKHPDAYVDTTAPTNVTMLSRLYDLQHNTYANAFKRYMASWAYYDLDPSKLRAAEAKHSGLWLNPDGTNLTHVLFQMKSLDDRRYRSFIKIVQEIEPRLDALNFVPPSQAAQDSVFMSLADSKGNGFSVFSISNGTLRFMAMAYVIIMTAAVAEIAGTPAPVVIIEEPENGIYVGHLRKLMDMVGPETQPTAQFIFSSHSPYFIDLFDRHLDGVFVMKSDSTHCEIYKPGAKRLETVLDDFDLGEAHFRELLGEPTI